MGRIRHFQIRLKPKSVEVRVGHRHLSALGPTVRSMHLGTDAVVLSNSAILHLYRRAVGKTLSQAGFFPRFLTIQDTERSKSLAGLGQVLTSLSALDRPGKRLFLILLGGGVVGDLGGVAAGLYRRGIPYVQIPTTLLAQVDSSIGGKTGIDLPAGKNLAGLFYQPSLVYIELAFLETLSDRQFRSGLAEVAKCGVIEDPKIFDLLEATPFAVLRRDPKATAWLVERAIRIKAAVVEADERETAGIRTVLNLGHTLGHALEAASHYTRAYTHGEAVVFGMVAAARISRRMKLMAPSEGHRIERLMRHLGFPTKIRGVGLAGILQAMSHDKKWSFGKNRWVLPTRMGRVVVKDGVPDRIVRQTIRSLMEGSPSSSDLE